jgi:hypothetical protein
MTEAEADAEFHQTLVAHSKTHCPTCGKAIDRGDVAWNNGETEAGTPYSSAIIQCQACDTEIARWSGWTEADNWIEFVEKMLDGWEPRHD